MTRRSIIKLIAGLWFGLSALRVLGHPELEAQIVALTDQLKDQPTNADLYLARAHVERQHAEFELALKDIATAARLRPGWSIPSLARAQTLFDAGRIEPAQKAVDEFLLAEPGHGTGLALRGHCQLKLGHPQQAIADWSAALKASAQPSPDLFVERASLQSSLGRFDEAIRGLDEGAARLANAPALQLAAIEYERQRGNFSAALERTEKLLAQVRQPATFLLRAQLLAQTGRLAEAQAAFREILNRAASPSTGTRQTEALNATCAQARAGLARVEAKLLRAESQK